MMCFNLKPGDRILVGGVVVAFLGKIDGRSRFELIYADQDRQRHTAGAAARVTLHGAEASFTVEKRSGRSTRIALLAPPHVAVTRLSAMVAA